MNIYIYKEEEEEEEKFNRIRYHYKEYDSIFVLRVEF